MFKLQFRKFILISISVSEPGASPGNQEAESIYEELKQKPDEPMIGILRINELGVPPLMFCVTELGEAEGYDHLDFRRPVNELKPQYLSTESILSQRSRNSSNKESPIKSVEELKVNTVETVVTDLSGGSSSDHNWTDSVLSSFEKLNNSGSRTRKCIYQPDTSSQESPGPGSISPTLNV